MISKNQIKLIIRLQQKKYRKQYGLFVAEGVKIIQELLQSNFDLEQLFITEDIFTEVSIQKRIHVEKSMLKKISTLNTANNCLALFKIPEQKNILDKGLIVMLDDIRDPGNLGTIVRLCDWFGVKQVICSEQTVDIYNPKVVQATMGSISRVNVCFLDLNTYLKKTKLPVFGTFIEGDVIYSRILPTEGIIIMGNEANGISSSIDEEVKYRLTIPRFGDLMQVESLNVATATAIVLSEFNRGLFNER